jgi:hypothetical protein
VSFALVCGFDATIFVEISDPANPKYLGKLMSKTGAIFWWHDFKTDNDHAFIVLEADGHGMQVLDLTISFFRSTLRIPPYTLQKT